MAKKTWFQHDMNATQKDGLSALIAKGGFEAYGRFWAFMELFYSMQINRTEFSEKIRIHEQTLTKHLQMNCRSLPKLLQLFGETLGIVCTKFGETYGIVYETYIPNSLNFITKRNQKNAHIDIERDIDIEREIYTYSQDSVISSKKSKCKQIALAKLKASALAKQQPSVNSQSIASQLYSNSKSVASQLGTRITESESESEKKRNIYSQDIITSFETEKCKQKNKEDLVSANNLFSDMETEAQDKKIECKPKKPKPKIQDIETITEIIEHLNKVCNTSYKPASRHAVVNITARLKENYTIDDFKTVIDHKSKEWLGNVDMQIYLRPETLFGNKFDGYLNAAKIPIPKKLTRAEQGWL